MCERGEESSVQRRGGSALSPGELERGSRVGGAGRRREERERSIERRGVRTERSEQT